MKFWSLIKGVDKTEANSSYIDIQEIANEIGIHHYNFNESDKLKCYYGLNWYCTDTYVGLRLYFLNDEFVFATWQTARKSDEVFWWASIEMYDKVKKHILSLVEDEVKSEHLNFVNFDEEIEEGFEIQYSSQLLAKEVIYYPTKEKVKVVQVFRDVSAIALWSKVQIQFPNFHKEVVNMSDIRVPYNLKKDEITSL